MKRTWLMMGVVMLAAVMVMADEEEFESRVIHIGMVVSDLEESMAFYKDIVGFVQVDRTDFDIDADFGRRSGLTDSLPFHVEVLKLGRGDRATELKLMSFGNRARKQENEFIHTQTGIQYLTIFVTELNPILERLEEAEIELLGETPIELDAKRHFVLFRDPDGTFVELIGPLTKRKRFNVFD